ncbi:MAG: hypothetical protein ACE5GM_00615 [bacterium]
MFLDSGKNLPDIPARKHPCKDCRFCQWCSDLRCRVCRGTTNQQDMPPGTPSVSCARKYPCPDCDFCCWCSDSRCRVCRGANP